MNKTYIIGGLVVLAGLVGLLKYLSYADTKPGPLDQFAVCLQDKGAKFYGAFWCPHCANQKKLFGSSKRLLPYEECSTADGQGQLQVCIDKKIETYPTWIFADESRLTGEIKLATLAEKTGCLLPN